MRFEGSGSAGWGCRGRQGVEALGHAVVLHAEDQVAGRQEAGEAHARPRAAARVHQLRAGVGLSCVASVVCCRPSRRQTGAVSRLSPELVPKQLHMQHL